MSQTALWTTGVLALLVLAFACFFLNGPRIEADIADQATAALAAPPLAGLAADVSGRSVTLRGTVPDEAARLRALAAAAALHGVARVTDALRVLGDGRTDTPEASGALAFALARGAGGGLVVRGVLPDESARAGVLARVAEAYPGLAMRDEMTVAAGADGAWAGWMPGVYTALAPMADGGLAYDGAALVLRGTAATPEARGAIQAAVRAALPEGTALRNEIAVAGATAGAASGGDASGESGASADASTGAAQVETDAAAGADVQRAGAALREALSLGQVEFESGTATLTPRSREILDRAATVFERFPAVGAEVQGHTDSQGGEAANERLSQQRAEAVRTTLLDLGVSPEALDARGYGEAEPIADNATAEGRARNRRVVFRLRSR